MKKLNLNILYILQCLLVLVGLCLQPVYAKDRIRYHINGVDGSTLQTIDEQGVTVTSYRYAPFGEQLALKKLVTNKTPVGFVGGVHDQDDLVYLKHRYYNPIVGRFYQPDPVTFANSGKLGQIHRYQYSRNDPFTFQDPSGLNAESRINDYYQILDQGMHDYFSGKIDFNAYSNLAQTYGNMIANPTTMFEGENLANGLALILSSKSSGITNSKAGTGIPGANGQLTANGCGMACGQRLLSEQGINVFQSNLSKGFWRGLTPETLAKNMNRYQPGWKGVMAYPTERDVQGLYSSYGKYIARLGGNHNGHFVTVESVSNGRVNYWDPSGGIRKSQSISSFTRNISGLVWKDK